MRRIHARTLECLVIVAAATSACDRLSTGVHVSVRSPDGTVTAIVLNHPTIDPPDQSLNLQPSGGSRLRLRQLSPDQDWCHQVFWSADSSTVVFLVQDARMLAYSRSGVLLADQWLVNDAGYPTPEVAWGFAIAADGAAASFRPCRRPGRSGDFLRTPPCRPTSTVTI